jgi:hypothetical protein
VSVDPSMRGLVDYLFTGRIPAIRDKRAPRRVLSPNHPGTRLTDSRVFSEAQALWTWRPHRLSYAIIIRQVSFERALVEVPRYSA